MRSGFRCAAAVGLLAIVVAGGCSGPSTSTAESRPTTDDQPKSEPKPAAAEVANYSGIPEAVGVLLLATESQDRDERLRVSKWLADQGNAAVSELSATLQEDTTQLRSQIAICRVLGQIGGDGVPILLEASRSETDMLRLNAIDQLGVVRPSETRIVDRLIEVLDHSDARTQQAGVQAIAFIGPPAQRAADRIQEIFNSPAPEPLRQDCRRALKKIDPRRTLVD